MRALYRRLCHHLRHAHVTIYESLAEPRRVTLATMTGYTLGLVYAVVVLSSVPGQLPAGVYSARLAAAITLGIGGLLGVPGAWRGWWFVEEVGVWFWGFGITMIGLAEWFDDVSGVQRATITFLAALAVLAAVARGYRVHNSPYRLGAGPLLPEHRVEVTIQRQMEADKRRET